MGTGGRAREGKAKWRDALPCPISLCKVPAPQTWLQTPPTVGMCHRELHSQPVPAALSMAAGPDPAFSQPPAHSNSVFLGLCTPTVPHHLRRGQDRATLRHVAGQEHSLCQHKTYICPQLLGKRLSLCLMLIIKILQMINKSARNSPCCIFLLWRQLANCFI